MKIEVGDWVEYQKWSWREAGISKVMKLEGEGYYLSNGYWVKEIEILEVRPPNKEPR